jgi:hypothetical protein
VIGLGGLIPGSIGCAYLRLQAKKATYGAMTAMSVDKPGQDLSSGFGNDLKRPRADSKRASLPLVQVCLLGAKAPVGSRVM